MLYFFLSWIFFDFFYYLDVYCLAYKCSKIFLISFFYWLLVWFHFIREHILHDFNCFKFVNVYYIFQDLPVVISLCVFYGSLRRICILLFCVEYSTMSFRVYWLSFSVSLLIFLPSCFIDFWEWNFEVFNYNCGFFNISF